MSAGERKRAGNKATVISVLPTADAPAGTTIVWNGRVAAGLVYRNVDTDIDLSFRDDGRGRPDAFDAPFGPSFGPTDPALEVDNGPLPDRPVMVQNQGIIAALGLTLDGNTISQGSGDRRGRSYSFSGGDDVDDLDVYARSRLRVTATTDTAVGEVGVTMEMRADLDGRNSDLNDSDYTAGVYMDQAWGWWAMTPELTFGGGYAASLADIGYGYDGACSCYFIDNADMAFNPGDTTQMRLSYGSGPFSMAVALEDASETFTPPGAQLDGDRLGVTGQAKYSGDTFSGELSGGWWDVDEDQFFDVDTQWQVGAGIGFSLGEMISFSVAAAMGEGPTTSFTEQGSVTGFALPINNQWWGVTALASAGLTDEFHVEVAGGYKKREGDDFDAIANEWNDADEVGDNGYTSIWGMDGFEYETWAVMGGMYYTPVDQLTIGLEGEWFTSNVSWSGQEVAYNCDTDLDDCSTKNNPDSVDLEIDKGTFIAAFVGVWRF
jgi:hypothetical protein